MEEKKLNQEQIEAVHFGKGPLLIIAGAGTGKTTVITERIKHLITSGLAKPSEILALTFTEKAAKEMEERVDVALPLGYTQMWIMTFHSFCDRVLRDEAVHIGLDSRYKLMTEAESIMFLRKNLFKFDLNYFCPLGNPNKFIDGMLKHFSRLKDEDVAPENYLLYAKNFPEKLKVESEEAKKYWELAGAYKTYEEMKVKEGVMDFGDLITNTLKLFRQRQNVLKQYQDRFKYLLVDEFQDTNYAQNELVLLLAGEKKNLTVVADDDQCLPLGTLISTSKGDKRIEEIKKKEKVITAVGKGYTSFSVVTHIFKTKKKSRFLKLVTDKGTQITLTDNHKMFCLVPNRVYGKKKYFYIYLMERVGLGWRLGVTNDLCQRLKLERSADRIIAIRACQTEEEARYFETFYSLVYHIPTICFKPRRRTIIKGAWMEKLFKEIDTETNVQTLAKDLGIDLRGHHFCLGAVIRGRQRRVKINLRICKRNYRTKYALGRYLSNPSVLHEINIETSDKKVTSKLKKEGYKILRAKKGDRVRISFGNLDRAEEEINKLMILTGGILDVKFDVGKRNKYARQAQTMAAGNVLPGFYIPVLKDYQIEYEMVVKREEFVKENFVYDLEVARTHNYVANGVVVHNSIYKWRGAAISNVIQLRKRIPETKIVVLTKNYRSNQKILDKAYRLIQNNNPDRLEVKEKIDKKLVAMRNIRGVGEVGDVKLIHADRVENEAEEVAKEISSLINGKQLAESGSYRFKDFAILVRANNHADAFIRALARRGIPYQFLGPGMLFRQPEVKDLIAYLEVLYNFEDSVALYRILAMDFFALSGRDLAAINNFARKNNLSLFEACEKIVNNNSVISEESIEIVRKLVEMIHRHLDLVKKETAGQIIYNFLEESGLLKGLTEYKSVGDERKANNIAKFFDKLRSYEVDHEDASVAAVVDWINLSMELGESPRAADIDWTENDAVNILTVHSAKGLEFPVVFLVNLVGQRFPTTERKEQIPLPEELIKEILPEGDYHLQEERRLFYVGMTRAKDRLYLTAADYYGEGKREKKISPFVYEVLGEETVNNKQLTVNSNQMSIFDFKPAQESKSTITNQQSPITYLSYSQIDTFSICPLQYKYKFILRIPTPPSGAAAFGSAIHETMRDFYQRILAGQDPTQEDLLKILAENWVSLGYSSKNQEEKYKREGEKILRAFYEKTYDRKTKPKCLEQVFSVKISSGLKIGGKIDRIDLTEQGVEVIDYKTGSASSKKDVAKDLQLTIYALVATDGTLEYMGILDKTPLPEEVKVSFYFFDNQEKVSAVRTREELEQVKKELIAKAEEIYKSDFSPSPGKMCDFCDYRLLCEAWR